MELIAIAIFSAGALIAWAIRKNHRELQDAAWHNFSSDEKMQVLFQQIASREKIDKMALMTGFAVAAQDKKTPEEIAKKLNISVESVRLIIKTIEEVSPKEEVKLS